MERKRERKFIENGITRHGDTIHNKMYWYFSWAAFKKQSAQWKRTRRKRHSKMFYRSVTSLSFRCSLSTQNCSLVKRKPGRAVGAKQRKIKRWKLSIKFEIKFSCHKFLCKKRFSLGMNFWLSDKARKTFRQAPGRRQRMKQWRSFFR